MPEDQIMTFATRPPGHTLPDDPELAVAAVLAYARGQAQFLPKPAIAELQRRVEKLRDPTASGSLDELARHLPVVESMWLSLAVSAQQAKGANDRAKLTRAALQCFESYSRGFALLRGLDLQRQGAAKVVVIDDASD
jgi:hypothetical protein